MNFRPIPECVTHKWQIKGFDCELRCRDCNDVPALPELVQNEMIRELRRALRGLAAVVIEMRDASRRAGAEQ